MAINKALLDKFEMLYPVNTFVRTKTRISCMKSRTEHLYDLDFILEPGELILIKEYVESQKDGYLCIVFIDKDLKERITGFFQNHLYIESYFERIG